MTEGHLVSTTIKDHVRHMKNLAVDKVAVTQLSSTTGHMTKFDETLVLKICNRYYDRMVLQAIEILQHKDNTNKEEVKSSKPWYQLLSELTVQMCMETSE